MRIVIKINKKSINHKIVDYVGGGVVEFEGVLDLDRFRQERFDYFE